MLSGRLALRWIHNMVQLRSWNHQNRVRPSFLVIGAQKSGTTALYDYLCLHPQITAAYQKETKYFDLYPNKSKEWYYGFFPKQKDGIISGEATPDYFFDSAVPERIHNLFPDIKLILILRDPVERAISHFNYNKDRGIEHLSLSEAIKEEEIRIDKNGHLPVELDSGFTSSYKREYSYIQRGKYINQLNQWLKYFNQNQFFICSTESLKSNPDILLKKIFAFLDIKNHSIETTLKSNVSKSSFSLSEEDSNQIKEIFKPFNEQLFKQIDERFNWK